MSVKSFGYSGTANDGGYYITDDAIFVVGTPTEDGNLDKIWIHQGGDNWAGTEYARAMVCVSSTGVIIAQTQPAAGTGVEEWVTFEIGPSSITSGEDYKIAVWGDTETKSIGVHQPADGKVYHWYKACDYSDSGSGDWVSEWNPFITDDFTAGSAGYAARIYATYTTIVPTYTSFKTPIGSTLEWSWNSGQFNIDSGMRRLKKDFSLTAETTSVVCSSMTNTCTRVPNERNCFYAKGKYWVVYGYSGAREDPGFNKAYNRHEFRTSNDGITWSAPSTMCSGNRFPGADFDICLDSSGDIHIVWAYGWGASGGPDTPRYRKGALTADGFISWYEPTQITDDTFGPKWQDPTIMVDSDDYPWITCSWSLGAGTAAGVIKSDAKDGTWNTESGFPEYISSGKYDPDIPGVVGDMVALTAGKMYLVFGDNIRKSVTSASGNLHGALYDSGWGSVEPIAVASGLSNENYVQFQAIGVGDEVHIVWQKAYSGAREDFEQGWENGKVIHSRRSAGGVWTSSNIQVGISHDTPNVTKLDNGDLLCFFASGEKAYYKRWNLSTGTWDANPTLFFSDTKMLRDKGNHGYSVHSTSEIESGSKVGYLYRVSLHDDDDEPYEVKTNWLTVEYGTDVSGVNWDWYTVSSSSIFMYPSGSGTRWKWVSGSCGL